VSSVLITINAENDSRIYFTYPAALSKDLPSRFQSTSKTGNPFLWPNSMAQGSFPCCWSLSLPLLLPDADSMMSQILMQESSHPTAMRRPSGGEILAQHNPIPGSSQIVDTSFRALLAEFRPPLEELILERTTGAVDELLAHRVVSMMVGSSGSATAGPS